MDRRLGCARVSIKEQSQIIQRETLLKADCVDIYGENESGKDTKRSELQRLLEEMK